MMTIMIELRELKKATVENFRINWTSLRVRKGHTQILFPGGGSVLSPSVGADDNRQLYGLSF